MKDICFTIRIIFFIWILSFFGINRSYSQGIAINYFGNKADSSAIFDVSSQDKGVLIPRMYNDQRDSITMPAEGLLIFNLTTGFFNYYHNNVWFEICGNCIPPPSPNANSNSPVCENNTLNLTSVASPGSTYSWTGPNGFLSSQQNPSIYNVTMADSGVYYISISNGVCSSIDSVMVDVNAYPISTYTYLPLNPGPLQNVTFYPDAVGLAYFWTFQNGTPATSTDENPVIQWDSAGSYLVNLTVIQNLCSTSNVDTLIIVNCPSNIETFNYTGTIESWVVPGCVSQITIEAVGARGGNGGNGSVVANGGKGARMIGTFSVTPGSTLKIIAGEMGESKSQYVAGGGGGSFVWVDGQSVPLIAAGGGGGGGGTGGSLDGRHPGIDAITSQNGTNGNSVGSGGGTGGNGGTVPSGEPMWAAGGCGWYSNGNSGDGGGCTYAGGGVKPLSGGQGGAPGGSTSYVGYGGFGGGGGGQGACNACGGGGGGGYSGGGGGVYSQGFSGGGGGGSFNSGTSQSNTAGYNSGHGYVIINY